MYIVLAILAFGIIIAIHELGHFLSAKALGVKVNELAIGMGPKILSKQGKETLYSLRLIPFGGFCSMEGEYGEQIERDDEDISGKKKGSDIAHTDFVLAEGVTAQAENYTKAEPERIEPEVPKQPDPRSFIAQKGWKKLIILAAGSIFNFIAAIIIIFAISLGAEGFISTTLSDVRDTLPQEGPGEILTGDKIVAVNGERLYYFNDYSMFMGLNAGRPVTLTLLRDGEYVEYTRKTYEVDGEQVYRYSLSFEIIEPDLLECLKYSVYQSFNFIRMIRVSIAMMVSGEASVTEVAGPVGIVSMMNTVGRESPDILAGIANIIYFTAFIGVNVAVVNMLPIPAMDGGRILFVFITWVIEKTMRRKLDPKYENYVNTGAFMLLIGLMVLIFFNDIRNLIN